MKISKEDALHLAKVLASVSVNAETASQGEHASAIELLRGRLDDFILNGEDADDDDLCLTELEFDGPVSVAALVNLPKTKILVGNASFGAPEESSTLEFDGSDEHENTVRLLIGDGENDPVVESIAFIKRNGDQVTFYQAGVLDEGHATHTVALVDPDTQWSVVLPEAKVMAVRP